MTILLYQFFESIPNVERIIKPIALLKHDATVIYREKLAQLKKRMTQLKNMKQNL